MFDLKIKYEKLLKEAHQQRMHNVTFFRQVINLISESMDYIDGRIEEIESQEKKHERN